MTTASTALRYDTNISITAIRYYVPPFQCISIAFPTAPLYISMRINRLSSLDSSSYITSLNNSHNILIPPCQSLWSSTPHLQRDLQAPLFKLRIGFSLPPPPPPLFPSRSSFSISPLSSIFFLFSALSRSLAQVPVLSISSLSSAFRFW